MIDRLRAVLQADERIAFALLFGSAARGSAHAQSDLDVAVGLTSGHSFTARDIGFTARDIGELTSRLESASGRAVHLVVLDEAPPGLAYRVFRDGVRLMVRDEQSLKTRLARAILDYLDFQPVEEIFTRGVLRTRHGR